MSIDHLFDVGVSNVHMVEVDSYEAAMPPAPTEPMASLKQLEYIKILFGQRRDSETAQILRRHMLEDFRAGRLTKTLASACITDILSIPKDEASRMPPPTMSASHGEVWVTHSGRFVRVKESQRSGNLYGMMWDGSGTWVYTPGVMADLDHQITAEEAAAWGHEHQWCVFCSRPLSDPRSEFAGYGETCARKRNLPWGDVAETPNTPVGSWPPPDDAEEVEERLSLEEILAAPGTLISQPSSEDVIERPYGNSKCRICNEPRPFVLNGYLRGCNC